MDRELNNDELPPQAMLFIVWSAMTHINFLTASRDIAAVTGRDAGLATFLSFGLILAGVWLPLHIAGMFPGMTLVEIARRLLGPFFGSVLAVLYVGYWIVVASWLLLIHSHLIQVMLLPETPRWVLNLGLLLICSYLVGHGLEPMARFFVLTFPAFVIPIGVGLFIGALDADFGRLLPMFESDAMTLLKGTWMSFVQATGMSVLWVVGPYVRRSHIAKRWAFAGVCVVGLPATALVTLLVARLGPSEVASQLYPPLVFIELLEIPGFTGFHLNSLFLAIWMVIAFASVSLFQYAAASSLRRVVSFPDIRWPVVITGSLLLTMSNLPISELHLLQWAETVRPYTVGVTALGIPLVLLVLASWRKAREKSGKGEGI